MSLDTAFVGALVDGSDGSGWSSVRIFGVRLRRFSLWHVFLLKAVSSPLIEKRPVTMRDLRTALAICRLEYPDTVIRRPWLLPVLQRIALIARALAWKGGKTKDGDNIFQRELRANVDEFLAYTADYISKPEYTIIPPETDGKLTKASVPRGKPPEDLETVTKLIGWTGWDDKKVWNLRVGYAHWLYAMAIKEQGADLDFITKEEKEFMSKLPKEYRHG